MKSKNNMVIKKIELYRVDAACPGREWSSDFKNLNYTDSVHGPKNAGNLFFFTDSERFAHEAYATSSPYFFTRCVASDIKVLDFSKCSRILDMLYLLRDNGFNVISNEFLMYESKDGSNVTFAGKFGSLFEELTGMVVATPRDMTNAYGIASQFVFTGVDIVTSMRIFGQRLTDFQNGPVFAKMLMGCGYDGYCWREHGDNGEMTYCIFGSTKLSKPIMTEHHKVEGDNPHPAVSA
jgi:hypothetical protein